MINKLRQLGYCEYSEESSYRTGTIDELHVDIYSNGIYNLFGRIIEKNAKYLKKDGRFTIFSKNNDVLLDIDVDRIEDSMGKTYSDSCKEVLFSIGDVRYKMIMCGWNSYGV